MEQPLAMSPTFPTREEGESFLGTPRVDLKQMLDGDFPQDKTSLFHFVMTGIRKLSDLNRMAIRYTQYVIGGT